MSRVDYQRGWRLDNPTRAMLHNARKRAKRKGLMCTLTAADIVIPASCPVLGYPLVVHTTRSSYDSPSLDRLRPSEGYIKGNCLVVSHRANQLKSNATLEEMRKVVEFYENYL